MPDDEVESVCPFCAVGCRLAYDPASGRATGREGAANPEGRLCPKGIAAFDGLDGDGRLTRPLVRRDGDLVPASWDEAYDRVVDGFDRVRGRHGADALAFLGAPRCTNEENYLLGKVARLCGTNNVDNRARSCHAEIVAAMADRFGSGAATCGLDDLAEADAVLVVGADPAERQPIAFDSFVRPAANAGATLIHVDPRAGATTRLADHHLAPRPGCDAALLTAMAAVVRGEGLVDGAFLRERTAGFASYARRLDDLDVGAAAGTAGVAPDAVRDAARAFGRADRAVVMTGTGIESDGRDAADAVLDLLLLTGNLGRRGTGMVPLRGLNNEQGANDAGCRPFTLPGYAPVTDAAARERVAGVWGVEPPAEPGRAESDLVRGFGDDVRAAWVVGENPAVTTLDADEVARGLDALDCLVVQEAFHTETVARADVVLPASAWAEKGGTVTNLDRQVQRMRPTAEPPGDARRDLRILRELGARLTGDAFDYGGPREVFEELSRVAEPYAGMTYEAIEDGGARWPFRDGGEDGVRILHRERFATGDRRAPFAAVSPTGPDDEGALTLITGRSRAGFTGRLLSSPDEAGSIELNPADAHDREIDGGDPVVVESDRGEIRGAASVTTAVRPGIAFASASLADPIVGDGKTRVRVRPERAD